MDFTTCGALEAQGGLQRARVQWSDKGAKRHICGPLRPDEDAAKDDLDAMRAVASGLSREDGFAAMAAEAERLKAGKPPSKQGSVKAFENGFFAVTGGDALQAPLAMYPFGIKEGPNGTSLAMHPSVGFAFQAQGYVSKGRRFLSDAPLGRFP